MVGGSWIGDAPVDPRPVLGVEDRFASLVAQGDHAVEASAVRGVEQRGDCPSMWMS